MGFFIASTQIPPAVTDFRYFSYRRMARFSNQQIVRELKEGDRLGCRHLVDLYQERLLGEATRVFRVPRLDAEELVSDVLLAVINKINTFEFKRSDGDFHYWLMTIFRNRVRDFMRHRAQTDGLWENFDEAALEDDETYSATEREVVRSILRNYEESLGSPEENEGSAKSSARGALEVIAEVLDQLETWERVLLRCRALEIPYEDIARYTGKTAKQLKVYHARVKKKFLNLLGRQTPKVQ
ncbi:MAG: sigma-70 family RNA polymerase sigma factor [Bacteroidota bacterium]